MPKNIEYQKVYFKPEISAKIAEEYPFSYNFIAQCLFNGTHRSNHETLDNSDVPKLFAIQMMFLNLNKRCVFDQALLERQGLDDYLTLPLNNESTEVSSEIVKAIEEVIKIIPQRGLIESDNKALQELVKLIGESKLNQYVPQEELKTKIKAEFKRITNNGNWEKAGISRATSNASSK